MNSVDTIVVGGGIAGLTAAAFLSKEGNSVLLYEKEHYFGGLVNSFQRGDFTFDGGLRSIENSGIVFPMLRQLGINLEFVKSNVSIGIEKSVLRLNGSKSIQEYKEFLIKEFPEDILAVNNIIIEVEKITEYMNILYGINNPIFLDFKKDREYLIKVIFPWLFKFLKTIKKVEKLDLPVEEYLRKFTKNKKLIDNIAQHFFKETPTSFALSYFSLYNDYNYPIGGTEALPKSLEEFSKNNGAILKNKTMVLKLNPEDKFIVDSNGEKVFYKKLIWACDLKYMYNIIDCDIVKSKKLKKSIINRKNELKNLTGAESVFTIYISANVDPEYFKNIATEHCFYTPVKDGLSNAVLKDLNKDSIIDYLKNYVKYNTFEISIPCLRDPKLAPEGKTGLEVSLLFDYNLTKNIVDQGWKKEFKSLMEGLILEEIYKLYPNLQGNIIRQFSSTPLTIERYTNNFEGAIVGWSFTNKKLPIVSRIVDVAKSVNTPIKNIYKAGQWAYSPAGMPISILTGKLAANKVLKG